MDRMSKLQGLVGLAPNRPVIKPQPTSASYDGQPVEEKIAEMEYVVHRMNNSVKQLVEESKK